MHWSSVAAAWLLGVALAGCGSSVAPADRGSSAVPGGSGDPGPMPLLGNTPTLPIEQTYYARGPWAVTTQSAYACCDSSGNAYDIWYPSALGAGGFQHPVITWGDGSNAVPGQYTYLLDHLASWGFIVVASESTATHTGNEIIDAAAQVVADNGNPASPFYRHVAVAQIGAMGHSQGAGGVIRALMYSGGFIKTAISIERPAQHFCTGNDCPSTANIASGAVFFINGSTDPLSPSTQPDGCTSAGAPNEQSDDCFYRMTPGSVQKLWATLQGPDHNDVQGQPGCPVPPGLCTYGVYGFLGYPTAWMRDQLQADAYAHQAFVAGGGEIFRETTNWANQASNIQ